MREIEKKKQFQTHALLIKEGIALKQNVKFRTNKSTLENVVLAMDGDDSNQGWWDEWSALNIAL